MCDCNIRYWILVLLQLACISLRGQNYAKYLEENAVPIARLDSLDRAVYDRLSDNRLIMVGEMHGTNEPVQFVNKLADLFTRMGDSVLVGFEIPADQMGLFEQNRTDSSIYQSSFFARNSTDGRASMAWASTLNALRRNPKVHIFFFDIDENDQKSSAPRDSIMYLRIKRRLQQFPGYRAITISGNVHNMIVPFNDQKTAACYLLEDTELQLQGHLCCLNHLYHKGSMLNNSGKGLVLKEIENPPSWYMQYTQAAHYLLLYPKRPGLRFHGIFFTETVSAAAMTH